MNELDTQSHPQWFYDPDGVHVWVIPSKEQMSRAQMQMHASQFLDELRMHFFELVPPEGQVVDFLPANIVTARGAWLLEMVDSSWSLSCKRSPGASLQQGERCIMFCSYEPSLGVHLLMWVSSCWPVHCSWDAVSRTLCGKKDWTSEGTFWGEVPWLPASQRLDPLEQFMRLKRNGPAAKKLLEDRVAWYGKPSALRQDRQQREAFALIVALHTFVEHFGKQTCRDRDWWKQLRSALRTSRRIECEEIPQHLHTENDGEVWMSIGMALHGCGQPNVLEWTHSRFRDGDMQVCVHERFTSVHTYRRQQAMRSYWDELQHLALKHLRDPECDEAVLCDMMHVLERSQKRFQVFNCLLQLSVRKKVANVHQSREQRAFRLRRLQERWQTSDAAKLTMRMGPRCMRALSAKVLSPADHVHFHERNRLVPFWLAVGFSGSEIKKTLARDREQYKNADKVMRDVDELEVKVNERQSTFCASCKTMASDGLCPYGRAFSHKIKRACSADMHALAGCTDSTETSSWTKQPWANALRCMRLQQMHEQTLDW